MKEEFNYREYLKSNQLLKEEEISPEIKKVEDEITDDFDTILKGIEQNLKKAEQEEKINEGFLTIAGLTIALPAIIGLIAKVGKLAGAGINKILGKKPTEKESEDAWFAKLGKISDDLHHLYIRPIEAIMKKFIKDEAKAKKVSNIIFHIIVASFLIASGAATVKALQAKSVSMSTLEGAMTAIKSGEIQSFIADAIAETTETAAEI